MKKLVNFFESLSFNQLRSSMRADLVQDFKFDSGILLLDDDFISRLDGDGIEIESLDEIDFRDDKTLGYNGQRVLIYIRDVSPYRDREEINLPKFHISTCSTLIQMWHRKRAERYVLYRRENGIFQINFIKDGKVDVRQEKLNVCKNCLTNLDWCNYGGDRASKKKSFSEFSIAAFFEKYPKSLLSVKPTYDADTAPINDYTVDWNEISKNTKAAAGHQCQNISCRVKLSGKDSKYLHVHHIDGQKNNNAHHNLEVLCIKCHAAEPYHAHVKNSDDYKQFINLFENR